MPILDEDEFNKQAEKGNRKYLAMAERNEEYHIIREAAVRDGLEGSELSMIMNMVDRILVSNANKKGNRSNKVIAILMGSLLTLGSLALMFYYFITTGRIVLFNINILATGMSILFSAFAME